MKISNSNKLYFISVSKKLVLLTFVAVAFFNCKNNEEKLDEVIIEETMEDVVIVSALKKGCYLYKENGSMINLDILKTDNPVEGNLTYALAEKDRNSGTFTGVLNSDKLVGTYTFQSEGKESQRQVAFMLKDNQLIEGYGELNEDGTMFKDLNTLNYASTMPLTKAICEQ